MIDLGASKGFTYAEYFTYKAEKFAIKQKERRTIMQLVEAEHNEDMARVCDNIIETNKKLIAMAKAGLARL